MSDSPEGGAVEVRDGCFFINDVEVTEDQAREAGWTPEQKGAGDAPSALLTPSDAPAGVDAPDALLGRLRAAYASGEAERETIIPIAPGRYHDLAAKYRPIDWDLRRRLQRQAQRTGDTGPEAEATFQSALVADACKAIVVRPKPGAEYEEIHTLVKQFGDAPIRFDTRLAAILGMELIGGESEGDICRLVFGEQGAFEVHMTQLTTWSTQVVGDDDEDEGEGGGRPT